jgi:O-antigen/teichoic acid export membrane protein
MNKITGKVFAQNAIWKFLELFGAQGITLILAVILARILAPGDYGIISLTMIFVSFSDILVQGGFYTVLVQKKEVADADYSAANYLSLIFAFLLYSANFYFSSIIAKYYTIPLLESVLKTVAVTLFFNAFSVVLSARLVRGLQFQKLFYVRMLSAVISGILGIWLAYSGYGVWSLVWQKFAQQLLFALLLVVVTGKIPIMFFPVERAKVLMANGLQVLSGVMVAFLGDSLYGVTVGKAYSPESLGFLDKGDQLPKGLILNANAAIVGVTLPTLSFYQGDLILLKRAVRRIIRVSCYVIFPLSIGLAASSNLLIRILLTEKWIYSTPVMQLSCFFYATATILQIQTQVFYSIGKNGVRTALESFKLIITIVLVPCAVFILGFHIYLLMALKVGISIGMIMITALFSKKYIDYNLAELFSDVVPAFCLSVLMVIPVISIPLFGFPDLVTLLLEGITGILVYVFLSIRFNVSAFFELKELLKRN